MKKHLATLLAIELTFSSVTPLMATEQPKVTWQEAKKTALEAVPGGTSKKLELDRENSRMVYEIEIEKDDIEHDIEIDANTGEIIKHTQIKPIAWDVAKKIALEAIPDGKTTKLELDRNRMVYKIEIMEDGDEYDIEVDAKTGAIIKNSHEVINGKIKGQKSLKKIRRIAQNKVKDANIVKMELTYEDDRPIYRVKMQKDKIEYTVKINALSGAVIKCTSKTIK